MKRIGKPGGPLSDSPSPGYSRRPAPQYRHLLKITIDPNAPASSRVRAADSVLDHTLKAIEIEDVEVRVSAIERSLKENAKN
jgi:hypothetical protein